MMSTFGSWPIECEYEDGPRVIRRICQRCRSPFQSVRRYQVRCNCCVDFPGPPAIGLRPSRGDENARTGLSMLPRNP
jgi:hypothetical protein